MKLALLAFLIAIPVGHYAAGRWLHRFAYRVDIAWWMYLAVGTLSLLIAFMTISFQSIRAASANPVTYSYSFIARSSSTAIMFTSNGGSRDYYIDNLLVEDVSPEGTYAERLNGSANEKYGLARWLVVAPGDVVSAEVYAKYVDTTAVTPAPGFLALLGQIAAKAAGVVTEGGHYNTSTSSFPFAGLGITDESEESGPKAYLNWLIFDRYDTLIDAGYDRLSNVPKEHGQNVDHEKLQASFTITEPGYVYLYLSNEEPDGHPVEVYFDDFKITHVKGKILAGGDYYPFGLPIDTRQVDQEKYRYGYQGQYSEKDSLTNWNTFQLRMYDARFGRWISPDPYGQFASPYVGMGNMPHMGTDPDGGWSLVGSGIAAIAGVGLSFALGDEDNWYLYAAGGFIAGGILGEIAHSSHDYASHAANGWDRFTSIFGEGEVSGATGSSYRRYSLNPKWKELAHSYLSGTSQGVKKEWCVYASSEIVERALGGKRKMEDFAKGQNGGQPLDKGVNSNQVGIYYNKNFPGHLRGQGSNSSNPAPSPDDIASQMKRGRIVSSVIDEGLETGYNHNVVMQRVQRNIKKPTKYRYVILDPAKGIRYVNERQYKKWYRVHLYLGK